MAASLRLTKNLFRSYNLTPFKVPVRNNYIVLLPEVPKDTAETNPLLAINSTSLPNFSKITPTNYYNAVAKTLLEYETQMNNLEQLCQDPNFQINFESIVNPIEKHLCTFDLIWAALKNQVIVKHSEPLDKIFWKLQSRVVSARSGRFHKRPIYHAFKEINADRSQLNTAQKRVVDKYLLEGKLGGIEITGPNRRKFIHMQSNLEKEKQMYKKKMFEITNRFSHPINDANVVRDFPPDLLHAIAENKLQPSSGPWKISLEDDVYNAFMKYCPDRDLRWNAWMARITRCSFEDTHTSNSIHIEEIRFQRKAEANSLGFDTYAELSMKTKMAQHVDNVKSMINSLRVKAKPVMEREIDSLKEFAAVSGFDHNFEQYDVDYWRKKQKFSLSRLDENEIQAYFPFDKVLNGLFKFCHNLFGIEIQDKTSTVNTWNDDVRFYEIYDNGNHIASFYYDMYARPEEKLAGSWVEIAQSKCDSVGSKAIAYLVTNFCPPVANQPSLLSFREVENLFGQLGKVLQHVLSESPYAEVSGLSNIEWDAVDVPSHFMKSWLTNYSVVKMISSHCDNQQPLPEALFEKIQQAKLHLSAYDLMHELYISDFDITIYTTKDFWLDIAKQLWHEYHCFPLHKHDCHPCSLPEIFSADYPVSYYSSIWAEMIGADVFEAFNEIDCSNPEALLKLGKRSRECFFALSGGCHSSEIFRMFRGRDPSPDALLRKYKLLENTTLEEENHSES